MALGGGYQPVQPSSAGFKVAKSTLVPLGGGTGALGPQQRRAAAAASSSAYPEKPGKAASGESLEKEYIYNLQQQVYFLELELKYNREQGGKGAVIDPGSSEPLDSSLTNLKGSYRQMEREFKASMEQEEKRQTELREEALRAVLHEKRTRDEKQKAVEQLAKVREQFSSQRQELTAEVVALQRELERCYLTEKTLRMELEQATTQLQGLKELSEGADTHVRLITSKFEEKQRENEHGLEREGALRKELSDEKAQHEDVRGKYNQSVLHTQTLLDQRRAADKAAETASAEARLLKIELEKEKQALTLAEQSTDFLVRESAKLKTARDEVVHTLELATQEVCPIPRAPPPPPLPLLPSLSFSSSSSTGPGGPRLLLTRSPADTGTQNARLKEDSDQNKLTKVMSRFMIRKMREKLTIVQDNHKRMEEARSHPPPPPHHTTPHTHPPASPPATPAARPSAPLSPCPADHRARPHADTHHHTPTAPRGRDRGRDRDTVVVVVAPSAVALRAACAARQVQPEVRRDRRRARGRAAARRGQGRPLPRAGRGRLQADGREPAAARPRPPARRLGGGAQEAGDVTTHLPTSTPSRPPSRTTLTGPLCPPNVSPQIELLQNENVHQAARLQLLEQRKDLAKALTSLGPQLEALKGFTDTNQEMASAIKDLIPAIQSVPAAPAPLPKVV